jgi:hypothetical protein
MTVTATPAARQPAEEHATASAAAPMATFSWVLRTENCDFRQAVACAAGVSVDLGRASRWSNATPRPASPPLDRHPRAADIWRDASRSARMIGGLLHWGRCRHAGAAPGAASRGTAQDTAPRCTVMLAHRRRGRPFPSIGLSRRPDGSVGGGVDSAKRRSARARGRRPPGVIHGAHGRRRGETALALACCAIAGLSCIAANCPRTVPPKCARSW